MKRLTLNETWRLCLKQWKWLVKEIKAHPDANIHVLKRKWVKLQGYGEDGVDDDCFFCEYAGQREKFGGEFGCRGCPARKVDKEFHCSNVDYNYCSKPIKFYKKILELNKIRTKK